MEIKGYVTISKGQMSVNGEALMPVGPDSEGLKAAYTNSEISYPKFHKMDDLSKLTILAFHQLKQRVDFSSFGDEEIAMIFANSTASTQTDRRFIDSYTTGSMPSPSLFVYTLPNILTGELAIQNKWYGENIFLVEEKFDPELFIDQINEYFRKGSKACVCGWIDSLDGQHEVLLFAVEPSQNTLSTEELNAIFIKHE